MSGKSILPEWMRRLRRLTVQPAEKDGAAPGGMGQAGSGIREDPAAGSAFARQWRSFLGWILSVAAMWEIMLRPLLLAIWPCLPLPASMLKEVLSLLGGLLGA